MAARAQTSRAALPGSEGEMREDAATARDQRPPTADAVPIDRARMSAEEKHRLALLLADLLMADLARHPPRE